MLADSIKEVLNANFQVVFICSVIVILIRSYDIIVNKKEFIFFKEILMLSFIIYCICLFQTVTFQDVTWSSNNVTLFKEITRYEIFSSLFYKNILGNILMFLPLGFYLGYFLKIKKLRVVFLMSILISLSIELTQLLIGRVFDIDDILLNVIGGLAGYFIYSFIDKLKIFKNRKIANVLCLIGIVIIVFYIGGIYV